MQNLLKLVPYLRRYRRTLFWGFLFLFLTNVLTAAGPRILGFAIDAIRRHASPVELLKYAGLILAIAVCGGIFRFYMRQTMIGVSRYIEYDIRNDFYSHIQTLSQSYFNHHKTGDLMARATNDLNAVRMVLGPGIMYSLNTVIIFIFVIGVMLTIDTTLTLLALIPFPILSFLVQRMGKSIHKSFEKIQEQFSTITAKAQESLSGIRVVKAYVREKAEINTFKKLNREYVDRNRDLIKIQALFHPMMMLFGGIGTIIVLGYGGSRVIAGEISLGDFVAFNGYMILLFWPMIALGWVINLFQRGSASFGRIDRIMQEMPEISDGSDVIPVTSIKGKIEFRDLTFTYPETTEPMLRGISFTITPGMTLAIVGTTGSGKTTLIDLIIRLYDAPDGTIFIDDIPIKKIPLAVLRSNIGYVPQETFLFSDTIKENIIFGKPDATMDEIQSATAVSCIKDTIEEFPDKYETMLGERGINLSGGQKQRVAITRAVIRQPSILILDDALSSVDTYTEKEILIHLKEVMKDRTSIIISHRISTIKHADLILVIDEGEIVEWGKHDELLAENGIYARLYQKQLLAEELETADK